MRQVKVAAREARQVSERVMEVPVARLVNNTRRRRRGQVKKDCLQNTCMFWGGGRKMIEK